MELTNLEAVLISVIAIGSIVSVILVDRTLKNRQKIAQQSTRQELSDRVMEIANVYSIMGEIISLGYCDKIVLYKGSNGGSIPQVGKDYKVKVLYSAGNDFHTGKPIDLQSYIKKYELIADGPAINVILQVLQTGMYTNFTESMDSGLFKDVHLAEGVKHFKFAFVGNSPEEVLFVAFESFSIIEEKHFPELNIAINRFKIVLKKYYNTK